MGQKTFRDLTTLRIGGAIKHYKEVKSRDELISAVRFAKDGKLPVFIIGGGSDILVNDRDFDGMVIKYTGDDITFEGDMVTAEAGCEWDYLVAESVKRNLQGVECLSGIPGSVGAAPIQNIGAYGQELRETFVSLTAYDMRAEKFVKFDNKDCGFSYRESVFKKPENWQRYIITSVVFRFSKDRDSDLKYESLKNYFSEKGIKNPSLAEVREAVIKIRSTKFENPKVVGNAGSFFKNPIISREKFESLKIKYPDIKYFESGKDIKIPAGWLIEKSGWKGRVAGNAGVSSKHALVLLNKTGRAKAEEIFELSEEIIKDVYAKFGINLQREVQLINFARKVAILGYGIEGQDAEKYFNEKGDKVTILDQKFDKDYLKNLDRYDLIVRSPGVRYFNKKLNMTTPTQIFFDNCPGRIIGVTGTKGKGTTSTLIYKILKNSGKKAYLAGNIGKPYISLLPKLTKESFVVLELSSFQLIDLTKSPYIAVVLDITSDHMDWHKNQKEYVDAKRNIVRHQAKSDYAVLNEEYLMPKSFTGDTVAKVINFSKEMLGEEYKEKLLLRGEHNWENIAAAVAVAEILKIEKNIILKTVRSFKGLEHRLELVGTFNEINFYNDSFATSELPTIAAIKSFTEPVTLILGGSDKGLTFENLRSEIEKSTNIRNLILIGEIGEKIGGNISGKKILNLGKTTMKNIVDTAFKITPKGGVVLLSPATASFDMFENYKDRGNQFKEAVRNLKQ